MSLVWSEVDLTAITSIQDPVYSNQIETAEFVRIYGVILQTLDGRDASSFVDFFFHPCRLNQSNLIFVDNDAREDFRDFAIEEGILPPLIDIITGDDPHNDNNHLADRKRREEKAIEQEKARREARHTPPTPRAHPTMDAKVEAQRIQKEKTVQALLLKIAAAKTDEERNKLPN